MSGLYIHPRLASFGLVFEDNAHGSEKVKWSEPGKTGMIISPPAEGLVSLG
ncbi:hypothetical protein [Desulfotruncus arcticus]|uniref:hypothetical protein n=1 Tax=Desulfotruncus arcticus TaxID=341036 RepID=UPI0013F4BDFB|nr:hypothetical protein [Desulfotruncus arcticus]